MKTLMLDSLRHHLTELLDRAQMDGLAVVPVDILRELIEHGPRRAHNGHEIVFPGATPTWFMRHSADCTERPCPYATVARRQFPAHDGCHSPGEFRVFYLSPKLDHLITEPIIQIGQ